MRLIRIVVLAFALGIVFVPSAAALDFNDDSEEAPHGEIGMLYHFELHSHGGCDDAPYHYVVESGVLPPGLKLSPESYDLPNKQHTGLIDGIPTQGGTYSAWIALKDYCKQSAELLFTFEIWPQRFFIANDTLKPARAGAAYGETMTTTGIRSTVTWAVSKGSLPSGLHLEDKSGYLIGTPTTGGSWTFTIQATGVSTDPSADGTRIDSKQFTINVLSPLAAKASRRLGEVGVPFHATLSATGGQSPYAWAAAGGLPPGLSVSGGEISGTPTAAGSYGAQVTVTDGNGSARTVSVPLRIVPRLKITTRALSVPAGRRTTIRLGTSGGATPIRWMITRGRLPSGLRLARAGTVSGTATAGSSARVTVRARDAAGGTATRTIRVSTR